MRGKYKSVQDLFVEGAVLELPDGQPMWVQVMNPFEADDARTAAATARARVMLALREHGSAEETQLRARYETSARAGVIEQIAEHEANRKMPQFADQVRYDPEWIERLDMVEQLEVQGAELSLAEKELVAKINLEYMQELGRRHGDERDFHIRKLEELDDEALFERYRDVWLDRIGNDRMIAEYEVAQVYASARVCDATRVEGGEWDHASCDHRQHAFESRDEVRETAAGLVDLIKVTLNDIAIGAGQGKGSGSPTSSSASSPTPSSPAESTSSTPGETSSAAPGTSTSPSPTP